MSLVFINDEPEVGCVCVLNRK